jgi:hypothetical protein
MIKLKNAQVAPVRMQMRAQQKCLCALCKMPLAADQAVLDHCHRHGALRGALHRSCNALLGVLENNRARYGLGDDTQFYAFLNNAAEYLARHEFPQTKFLHPTFLTEDEKRLKRNAKARTKRAAAKKEV